MKKFLVVLVLILAGLSLSGCYFKKINGSGEVVNSVYTLSDATNLNVSDFNREGNVSVDVFVCESNEQKVIIYAEQNIIDSIDVKVSSDDLNISGKKYTKYICEDIRIEIYGYKFQKLDIENVNCYFNKNTITGNNIVIDASGASNITICEIISNKMDAEVSGASKMSVLNLNSTYINVKASGASTINLNGNVNGVVATVSGASNLNFSKLYCENVDVDISGASDMEVNSKNISGEASGASKIDYYGDSNINVKCSGASSVNKK